ncbi:MAG: hypothetical protein WA432_01265 [Candidatus Babeliaceae bacterium]
MLEKWIQWQPIPNLMKKYYIDSISDTFDGFIILLSDENNKSNVRVMFENSIDAYRSTDESFRLKTIHDLGQYYGSSFYTQWTFFKVINSEYLHWLSEQSYKITDTLSFIHFSFIAADSILDVVTNYEPRVELIKI